MSSRICRIRICQHRFLVVSAGQEDYGTGPNDRAALFPDIMQIDIIKHSNWTSVGCLKYLVVAKNRNSTKKFIQNYS